VDNYERLNRIEEGTFGVVVFRARDVRVESFSSHGLTFCCPEVKVGLSLNMEKESGRVYFFISECNIYLLLVVRKSLVSAQILLPRQTNQFAFFLKNIIFLIIPFFSPFI
jgi:hypothetical protein